VAAPHFADQFIAAARQLQNPLCVGLDPHMERIPREFGVAPSALASDTSAAGVGALFEEVIDACAGRVPVIKPQIAFFEQLGWRGLRVLEALVTRARERGLLVILDAKRGDLDTTARAYANSYVSPQSPCRADAITLSPYLGLDSLQPFVEAARDHGVGLFVLARTSNRGASDFQSLVVDGVPLYERVARALRPLADGLRGASGYSSLGIVAGATYPAEAERLRAVLPDSLFLVPGYGAQGGKIGDALASFVRRSGALEGGMINSSRGVLFGDAAVETTRAAWRAGFLARLDAAVREVSEAVHASGAPANS
jgi:orotidine-5'-phosphate decarboxylase